MKLVRIRLRNFRCYKDEIGIDFENITAIVGRNDAGKSAVLEALDIFLNDSLPDKHDASKNGDPKDLAIICEFDDLPEEAVIDDVNPTSLKNEYLLNQDGRLEIHKIYDGGLAKPNCSGIYAYAVHPSAENVSDLLQLKNSDLKKRAKDLGVDLKGIDARMNAPIRERIREHIKNLESKPILIPLNEDNAKKVWDGLKASLPAYALFKSDRASTDQDPEAQDPLKAAIKEAVKAKEKELQEITNHVIEEVEKIASLTLEKIREMDPNLASELKPVINPPSWHAGFKASITGDDDIPINKRGSGVKRLILLNFFRAKAEQLSKSKANIIYAIEEPETSQHPDNQRMLLRALTDLAEQNQVVVSTHTPMLARALPDNCLRYVHINEDKTRSILVGGGETNRMFSKSLGVLPDNSVKIFIGVEGVNDIHFLSNIAKNLNKDGTTVPDLEQMETDGELIFFPLGGSNLAVWTCRLENLNRPEFHLYDRDTEPPANAKYQTQADEINGRRDNCKAVITSRKEMENYLHFEAINQAYRDFDIELGLTTQFGEHDDVPHEVAKRVYELGSDITWDELADDKKKKKMEKVKRNLNGVATAYMTKEMLDSIDAENEVLSWLNEIKEIIA